MSAIINVNTYMITNEIFIQFVMKYLMKHATKEAIRLQVLFAFYEV